MSSASYYNADQVSSRNYANFTGYETIFTSALDPVSIVGSNTKSLTLGISNRNSKRTPSNQYRIAEIVDKGTNIENMTIWGASGFSDISILSSLNLKSLEICYSSLYGLKTGGASFENMANNLTTLTISDCSSFNSLDGLDKLTHITNLDLSNNSSLEDIQTITKSDGSKESKNTCQYIVESLPSLEKVTLSGCGLKNFSYLTSHGFKETSNGSRVFTKSN